MLVNKKSYNFIKVILFFAFTRKGSFSIKDISGRLEISIKVLEQVLLALKHEGILASKRGPGGGYALKYDVYGLSVADIIGIAGQKVEIMPPGGSGRIKTIDKILYHAADGIEQEICRRLHEITVRDLVKEINEDIGEKKFNYVI